MNQSLRDAYVGKKPHPTMVAAVRAVRPEQRMMAAIIAELAFLKALDKLTKLGDFDQDANVEMAAEAAAAEVAHRFA